MKEKEEKKEKEKEDMMKFKDMWQKDNEKYYEH